jgi:hypothetical protein
MDNPRFVPPRQFLFDGTPEIHATDASGNFSFPLKIDGEIFLPTSDYDEVRFVFSLWHPSSQRSIDLDRAYVELRAAFEPGSEHWIKIAEIEPVVPPYSGGEAFDGWIVLPVLGTQTSFTIIGSGFEPRARLQIKASAYMVA